MGLGVSVNDTHGMNNVGSVLPEVTDQEVSLLFRGLWRRRAVLIGRTYGPVRISLRPLHSTTVEDEGVFAHVRGVKAFPARSATPS